MRTPQEIFDIQKSFIERSNRVLATVEEQKLVAWNSTKLLSSTLLAWLMAIRNGFEFSDMEIEEARKIVEDNLEVALKHSSTSVTEYLFACMLTKAEPLSRALEFAKEKAEDIDFLVNSSIVPYAWFDLVNIETAIDQLESISDNKRSLSIESSIAYLELIAQDVEPSQEELRHLKELYKKRKSNSFYTESRLYGGGVDNDLVCDIEYAAIAICKDYSNYVL